MAEGKSPIPPVRSARPGQTGETGAAERTPRPQRLLVGQSKTLALADVLAIVRGQATVALDPDLGYRAHLRRGVELLARRLAEGQTIYGVTTGFGENCQNPVAPELAPELALNLFRFHGCGTGRILEADETMAVVAVRLASLARGYSAVRAEVLERLCDLLNHRILPCIPAEGSVGASGDLTPLSYIAAVLVGEREVILDGQQMPASEALTRVGLEPVVLGPKESLAIMNGTSVMTGLACLAFDRSLKLARLAASLTAMASDVMRGNPRHFDDRLFALKPHPGQRACARWIREDIEYERALHSVPARVQDRYSIRCAPHVIGVLLDFARHAQPTLEVEINSVNDNPIVDPDTGEIFHGGNFYGGHAAYITDTLKTAVANIADLLDRQFALLANPMTSHGLPANLVDEHAPFAEAHHGFKAMQISASALTAEALKLTMPASVFSRSTESHNQDKVSMGTISARDAQRVLDLSETVAAICLLALCQAVDLRQDEGCHHRSRVMRDAVREHVPKNTGDRRMDTDIRRILELYRAGELPIGEMDVLAVD